MEELIQMKLWLEQCTHQKNLRELRELRKLLQDALTQVDHTLKQQDPKTRDPYKRCPKCQSSHVRKHGVASLIRIFCLDCSKAYVINRQPLYYRRRHHNKNKILDLIVEIHTTNKSATEIITHLKISSKTYYAWRKVIISIFPQLEPKFKNRRKSSLFLDNHHISDSNLDNFLEDSTFSAITNKENIRTNKKGAVSKGELAPAENSSK